MMLDEARAELLRRLAHDLRSPLNVLDGALQELGAPPLPEQDEEKQRVLALAQRSLNRLHRLTERLTLAGRIDQGLSPSREQVELRALVADCWHRLQSAEPRSKIGLILGGEAVWQTDRALLAALLGEVLMNALKHARGQVTVQLEGPSLSVEDDGDGVENELAESLFQSAQPRRAGLGLGLPMASHLAAALQLSLTLGVTAAGVRSRFTVRSR
jgi:signal transduction histidine kinase